MQLSVAFSCTLCFALGLGLGLGHSLGHSFDGNSFAGHFDMDEECGGGQTGTICFQ